MIESNNVTPVLSESYVCVPFDRRCRYWAKVLRDGMRLPLPGSVTGATSIPGDYIRQGDEIELFPGDWLVIGEANHPRQQRGWTYKLLAIGRSSTDGEVKIVKFDFGRSVKDACRAAGRRDLLLGSGDVAAMIRTIHARRDGVLPMPCLTPRAASAEVLP